jgi:SGNH domain (fused to AT3 domains)
VLAFALTPLAGRTPEASARGTSVRAQIARSLELAEQEAPLPSPLVNLSFLDDDVWHRHFDCFAAYQATRVPVCPLGATSAHRTVVAMGDSHMGQWLATLDVLGKRRGFKVIPLIKISCSPYDVTMAIKEVDGEYTECTEFRRWARRRIARWRPAAVVLVARVLAAGSAQTTLEQRAAEWKTGVESGVRRLLRSGARSVKVLSDLPEVAQDPGGCLREPGVTMASCMSSPGSRVTRGNEVVRDAARAGGAAYVNVMPLVCLRDLCPAVVGRIVTFRDDDHITITWAKAVVRELGGRLGVP